MKQRVVIFFFMTSSLIAKSQNCDISSYYETVFNIYQEELEPYLTKFSYAQYKDLEQSEEYKLMVQTRLFIYRDKTKSLKSKCLEGIKKVSCKGTEMETISFISGFLDEMFRYEFPGLDFGFYDKVNVRIAKLSVQSKR